MKNKFSIAIEYDNSVALNLRKSIHFHVHTFSVGSQLRDEM